MPLCMSTRHLSHRGIENPIADRYDQAGFFGEGDETHR